MDNQTQLANFASAFHAAFQNDDNERIDPRILTSLRGLIGRDATTLPAEYTNAFAFQIAFKRFSLHAEYKLDLSLIALCVTLASNPGDIVMIGSYCQMKNLKTIDDFVLDIGFDSAPDSLSAAWDTQKVGGSNVLDNLGAIEEYRKNHLE